MDNNFTTESTHQKSRGHRGRAHVFLIALLTAAALFGSFVFSAATADAQEVEFAVPRIAISCSGDETTYPTGIKRLNGDELVFCIRADMSVLKDAALCVQASIFLGHTNWREDKQVCQSSQTNSTDGQCHPPLITHSFEVPGRGTRMNCIIPVFSTAGNQAPVASLSAICIESPMIQDNEALEGLSVGSQFLGTNGQNYLITTGAPTCSFNCAGGFDVNCDGKLFDTCSSALDLWTVAGAKQCLASLT